MRSMARCCDNGTCGADIFRAKRLMAALGRNPAKSNQRIILFVLNQT